MKRDVLNWAKGKQNKKIVSMETLSHRGYLGVGVIRDEKEIVV